MKMTRALQSELGDRTEQLHRERAGLARWLLDFLRRDLRKFKATDWSDLQSQLDHLTWKLVGGGTVFPVTWLKQLESKGRRHVTVRRGEWVHESRGEHLTFLDERRNEPKFRARLPRLTRNQMRELQSRLRQVLEDLRPSDPQLESAGPRIVYTRDSRRNQADPSHERCRGRAATGLQASIRSGMAPLAVVGNRLPAGRVRITNGSLQGSRVWTRVPSD